MFVTANGSKSWRLAYRYGGKQKTYTIGLYPDISLADARFAREEAKKLLAQGIDPLARKQEKKSLGNTNADANTPVGMTFEQVATEWFEKMRPGFSESYAKKLWPRYTKHLFPYIGSIPMADLRPRDILKAARVVEVAGHAYSAHLVATLAARVCSYAQVCEYCETNAAAGLSSVLVKHVGKHRAAVLKPSEFGSVLASLDHYTGHFSTRYALRLMPYVFLRSVELRGGRWEEVDFDSAMWIIPASRMKRREEHFVPLARQVVDILRELKDICGDGELMFPSSHSRKQPLSDMGLLNALRRLGYSREELCVHGFRSSASTLLNNMGRFSPDIIEAQLAHQETDRVRAAYNRNDYMEQRREMMQVWADFIDGLREKAASSK